MAHDRLPLYYTFGNHMHWVDMQWLWGYEVLPGSVADMLRLCEATGARGNVNFDAVGYEKMAAEAPEALAALREAVASGVIEPVGCSYGQPYGQFQGGESNVRQLTYGVRTTRRLLGVRPRTFWEEEFYFFPQLAQMLRSCGYTGACLFFQWTWHTPEMPKEPESLILWEGIDGTRLPALPRNDLNLHQWPEDFDGLLESGPVHDRPPQHGPAAIVQWLELMPSRDWMCRSEVLLPRLKELMGDQRFEMRPRTASGLISELAETAEREKRPVPLRRYGPDDVWHGMTLGKNADAHPRASRDAEQAILAAESLSALAGLFGRPYASWDVYPTWELEEAWRNALAAQHHDNHECEGLCGFVGHGQFEQAQRMAAEVSGRAHWLISRRAGLAEGAGAFNNLGWERELGGVRVPPFGYAAEPRSGRDEASATVARDGDAITMARRGFEVRIDARTGRITHIGASGGEASLLGIAMQRASESVQFRTPEVSIDKAGATVRVQYAVAGGGSVETLLRLVAGVDAIDVWVRFAGDEGSLPARPDPGLKAALQASFTPGYAFTVITDSPYAAHEVAGGGSSRRKYPTADWMTSPQWFETLERPFTSTSFVDLRGGSGGGLLIAHDGSQQWFRDDEGVRVVLTAYDPWDEGRYSGNGRAGCRFRVFAHKGLNHAKRVQRAAALAADAAEFAAEVKAEAEAESESQPVGGGTAYGVEQDIPATFGTLEVCGAPGVLAHAFFRESMKSGEHLPDWAGHRMVAESGGACTHPYVIRLVEWNGEPAEVTLKLPGPVALAAKTNLLGEVGPQVGGGEDTAWLAVEPADPPDWAVGAKHKGEPIPWSQVHFKMRPREIATVMADLVIGRKQFRDLDARREVWATVHKE